MESFKKFLTTNERKIYPVYSRTLFIKEIDSSRLFKIRSNEIADRIRDAVYNVRLGTKVNAIRITKNNPSIVVDLVIEMRDERYTSDISKTTELLDIIDQRILTSLIPSGGEIGSIWRICSVTGVPSIKTKTKTLLIDSTAGPSIKTINLHDIWKTVDCEVLSFYNPDQIDGCVLGILKIPSIREIRMVNFSHNNPFDTDGWFDIVKRHVEGDKDVLDCQEELRTAGLRQYGKF